MALGKILLFFEFDNEDKINILIYILHNIFDINLIIQERSWYMLNNQQQNNFKSKWINLKEAIKKKKNFIYSYDILKNVFVSFVSYFEIHYKNILQLTQKDKTFKNLKINLDEEHDLDMFEINNEDVKDVMQNKYKELFVGENFETVEHPYTHIFINEAQFFPDLKESVIRLVEY